MARRYTGDASKGLLPGPAVVQTLLVGPDSDLESEGKFTDTDLGRLLEIGLEVPRESVASLWTAVALVAIVVLGDVPGAPALVFSSFEVVRRNEASLGEFVGAHWKDPLLGLPGCGPSSARVAYRRVRETRAKNTHATP